MPDPRPTLHICRTCTVGIAPTPDQPTPGQMLLDVVNELAGETSPARIEGVNCLSACKRGCTAAITQPGKWSYVLGQLEVGNAADLLIYAAAYAASSTGVVLKPKRPEALRSAIIGRVPAMEPPAQEVGP